VARFSRILYCSLICVLLQVVSVSAQVSPAPSLNDPNLWYGQNSSPPCVVANGATISVNAISCVTSPGGGGIDLNTITLAQNSTFAFPTGLPVKGNFKFGFRINHGTGPYTAQFASGYQFPSTFLTNGQPTLSTSGTDYVWCVSEEGSPPTTVDCTASMLVMTPHFVLDGITASAFAYSLRRLTLAYTGNVVNIRRVVGSPSTTDIGFNSQGDFDATAFNTFCTGTTCFLTTWYDQSGNGLNCVQATTANQPQVVLASLGGRASLQTTGFAGQMYCATPSNSLLDFAGTGHSVFYVLQYTAVTDGGGTGGGRGDALEIVSHYNSTTFQGWAADAGDTSRAGSTLVYTDSASGGPGTSDGSFGHLTAINNGNLHFAGWTFASGTVKIYQDANVYTSPGPGGVSGTFATPVASGQGMTVLAAGDVPVDAFFSGNFAEVYGWSSALTSGQIAGLFSAISAYY
jgi:hypothetical protein